MNNNLSLNKTISDDIINEFIDSFKSNNIMNFIKKHDFLIQKHRIWNDYFCLQHNKYDLQIEVIFFKNSVHIIYTPERYIIKSLDLYGKFNIKEIIKNIY